MYWTFLFYVVSKFWFPLLNESSLKNQWCRFCLKIFFCMIAHAIPVQAGWTLIENSSYKCYVKLYGLQKCQNQIACFSFTGTASPTEIQILGVEFVLCEIDAGTERVPKQMGKFKSGKSLGMRVAFLSSVFVTLQIILWSTHPRLPVLTLFLVLGTCRPFMTRLITPSKDGKNSCKSINISF